MADSEYVQLAIRWIQEPLHCATFLVELIQEFESMFTLDGGTDNKGEEWVTVETTNKYRGKLAGNLSSQIVLTRQALTLCIEQKSEVFRLDPEWQSVFGNLETTLVHRSILGIVDKAAVPEAEEKLAEAFLVFRHVVKNLEDRIAVSIATSTVLDVKKPKGTRKKPAADKIRKKVWDLHDLGRSGEEISREVNRTAGRVSQILTEPRPEEL
jgi:hypothetical protein